MNAKRLLTFVLVALAGVPAGAYASPRPLGMARVRAAAHAASLRSAADPVVYHGGPVVHANTVHAIFWDPTGRGMTVAYKSGIARFFADVAAGSNRTDNVFAVTSDYADATGPARYQAQFGGTIVSHDRFPLFGCPPYARLRACLTDRQIRMEINRLIVAARLPRGLGQLYFL